jgi:DNA-damage-inducible protein J
MAATATEVVRARIDPKLKSEAESVLSELGLTSSDAIRMLMTRIAKDKALPLPIKVPNPGLVEAMAEAESIATDRDRRTFASAEDLFSDLEKASHS